MSRGGGMGMLRDFKLWATALPEPSAIRGEGMSAAKEVGSTSRSTEIRRAGELFPTLYSTYCPVVYLPAGYALPWCVVPNPADHS